MKTLISKALALLACVVGSATYATSPSVSISTGARTVNIGGTNLLVADKDSAINVSSTATDGDGGMIEHNLDFQRPDGQWSFQGGWSVGLPYAGAVSNQYSSTRSVSYSFGIPGTWHVRSAAYESANWHYSDTLEIFVNELPFGAFDTTNSSAYPNQTITGSGWAADSDTGAPIDRVEIWIDSAHVTNATLGSARSDVASYFARSDYLYSGWNFSVNIGNLSVGNHTVKAVYVDPHGGRTESDAKTLSVAYNSPPEGFMDPMPVGKYVGQPITFTGWANDAEFGSPVARVEIWIQGNYHGNATLGLPFPGQANPVGWSFTQPGNISPGIYTIQAIAFDALGVSTSLPVHLYAGPYFEVVPKPVMAFTSQPQPLARRLGQSISFSATVDHFTNPAPTFQWQLNGLDIPGATSATYSKSVATYADAGVYTLRAQNSLATIVSNEATLTITSGEAAGDTLRIHNLTYPVPGPLVKETEPERNILAGDDDRTGGVDPVIIPSGASVDYIARAPKSIRLVPGFHAQTGSTFRAKIDTTTTAPGGGAPTLPAPMADTDGDGFFAAAESVLSTNAGSSDNPNPGASAGLPSSWGTLTAIDSGNAAAVGVTSGELSVGKDGSAGYSIPLWSSPGVAGMEPKLTLNYSSQGGAGIAGWGWSIGGISAISRGPRTIAVDGVNRPVEFTTDDRFYLDGQRLILVGGTYGAEGSEYRTETESFTRIVAFGIAGNGPARFRAWTKAGLIIEYGNGGYSDFKPDNGSEVLNWSVSRIYDTSGNYMSFTYETNVGGDDFDQRLKEIAYTGHSSGNLPFATVVFNYATRTDSRLSYIVGRRMSNNQRLTSIQSKVGVDIAREYVLHYNDSSETRVSGRSLLLQLEEKSAYVDGVQKSLPRLSFTYETPTKNWEGVVSFAAPAAIATDNAPPRGTGFVDLNGDGRPDFVRFHRWDTSSEERDAWINTGSGWVQAHGTGGQPDWRLPTDSDSNQMSVLAWDTFSDFGTRLIDLNGDGRVDVVHSLKRGSSYYSRAYLNNGAGWTYASNWELPSGSYIASEGDTKGSSRLVDLNGDGLVDVIWNYDSSNRGALLNTGSGWQSASGWTTPFTIDGAVLLLDVNGDGLPDLIKHWYGGGSTVREVALNTGSGWQYLTPDSTAFNQYTSPYPITVASPTATYAPVGAEVVDLNGDGLMDMVWNNYLAGYVGAYLNTGRGWTPASSYQTNYNLMENNTTVGSAFIDVNGDGIVDQVVSKEGNPYSADGVYLGTGRGWTAKQSSGEGFNLPRFISRYNTDYSSGMDFVDLDGDGAVDQSWNLRIGVTNYTGAWRNTAKAADRLVAVTTGLGVSSTIAYKPLTDSTVYAKASDLSGIDSGEQAKVANVTGPMYVVSAVAHDDGVGGQYTINYAYAGLRSHRERGSLGFNSMTVKDDRTHTESTTEFAQNFPFVGMPVESVTTYTNPSTSATVELSHATTDYRLRALPNGRNFVFAREVTQVSRDLNNDVVAQSTTTYHANGSAVDSGYDDYGNSLYVKVDSGGGYAKVTTSQYDNNLSYANESAPHLSNATKWHLGRLTRSTVVSTGPNVDPSVPTSITRTSTFTYDPFTGLLLSETVEPDQLLSSPLRLTTNYAYDKWGNKTKVFTIGVGLAADNAAIGTRLTETDYTNFNGRFPAWTRNALGHAEAYSYDARYGAVTSLTGPNGLTTQWKYDSFGRKIQEDRPEGDGVTRPSSAEGSARSRTVISYGWAAGTYRPPGALYFIETRSSGSAPSVEFYDKMGRALGKYTLTGAKRKTPDAFHRIVGTQTRYDSFGRAYRTSLPFLHDGTPMTASFVTSYDDLGRPLRVITSADSVAGALKSLDAAAGEFASAAQYTESITTYAGLTTTTTNVRIRAAIGSLGVAAGSDTVRTQSVRNLQGWVMTSIRNSDAAAGADERAETAFVYDPLGQLYITQVRNTSGWVTTTSLGYDLRGRKTSMVDASMGSWSYGYNSAGELTSQIDAKGQSTTLLYDSLGRMVQRVEPGTLSNGTTSGTVTTSWVYDMAYHGGASSFPSVSGLGYQTPEVWVGKLSAVWVTADRSRSYLELYGYDAPGRSKNVTRHINGSASTTTQQYDDYGRPSLTIYPGPGTGAGYAVRTVYDGFGFPLEVRDGRDVAGFGMATPLLLNETQPGFIYWQAEDWSIWGLKTATLGNGLRHNRNYSDATGRVTSLQTGVGLPPDAAVQYQEYFYDSFGNVSARIDLASGVDRRETFTYDALDRVLSHKTLNAALATISNTTYAFDPLGNLKNKSDNGGNYTYGDSAHPYRVTAANGRSYTYDAVGAITYDGQRNLIYAASGQMQRIQTGSATSEFWFGAARERVIQQKGNTATIYIGSLVEKDVTVNPDGSFGVLQQIRYYVMTPQGRTAVRTETPATAKVETRWFHQDALGSINAVTNEWAQVERRFSYDAWGKQAQTSVISGGSLAGTATVANAPTRGYTDHEMLGDFGLIHMNGRVYDPVLGRFLSADPFVDNAGDGQSFNRYSYVSNNPLNATDPSGFFKLKEVLPAVIGVIVTVVAVAFLAPGSLPFLKAFMAGLSNFGAVVGGGAAGGFASGFSGSLLNGGSVGDAFKAGATGAITGAVSAAIAFGIGQFFDSHIANGFLDWSGRAASHGVAQGAMAELGGGEFRHGFYAAAFSSAASPAIGKLFPEANQVAQRTAVAAMIAGTAATMGGGKFANGALTGAFTHMFNAEVARYSSDKITQSDGMADISFFDALAKSHPILDANGLPKLNSLGNIQMYAGSKDFEIAANRTGKKSIPVKSYKDIIKYLKDNPGKYGSIAFHGHGDTNGVYINGDAIPNSVITAISNNLAPQGRLYLFCCNAGAYAQLYAKLMPSSQRVLGSGVVISITAKGTMSQDWEGSMDSKMGELTMHNWGGGK